MGSDDGDNVITVRLADNDSLDDDPRAGDILDPGAPGFPIPEPYQAALQLAALTTLTVLASSRRSTSPSGAVSPRRSTLP